MTVNRLELVGLSVLVLTLTTTVSEQNVNPVLSGVSPSLPTSLLNQTTGTNPFTGLLCREGDLWEGGGP